jgi:hypothetical protein
LCPAFSQRGRTPEHRALSWERPYGEYPGPDWAGSTPDVLAKEYLPTSQVQMLPEPHDLLGVGETRACGFEPIE